TAFHHDKTHECPTTMTGAFQGNAPCTYPFKWTTSGLNFSSRSSSHSPAHRVSSQGSSIHSSLKVLSSTRSKRAEFASLLWAGLRGTPIIARITSIPSAPSAFANSRQYVHTPPTASPVISTRRISNRLSFMSVKLAQAAQVEAAAPPGYR